MEDAHHLLHNKQEWSLRPDGKALRETPSLIPRIDRGLHNEIHRNVPAVPLLGYFALQRTLREFYPTRDTLSSMDNLIVAMDIASKHHKAHVIEKAQVHLSIWALELQRPYIAEYFNHKTIIDLGAHRE